MGPLFVNITFKKILPFRPSFFRVKASGFFDPLGEIWNSESMMLAPEQRDLKQKAAADRSGRSEPLPVLMRQISDDSYAA